MVKACLFAWGRSRYIISVEVDWNALEKMAFEYKNRGRASHLTTTVHQNKTSWHIFLRILSVGYAAHFDIGARMGCWIICALCLATQTGIGVIYL